MGFSDNYGQGVLEMGTLSEELKKRFRRPGDAIRALGLPEDLLGEQKPGAGCYRQRSLHPDGSTTLRRLA